MGKPVKLTEDLVELERGGRHLFFRPSSLVFALTDGVGAWIIRELSCGRALDEVVWSLADRLSLSPAAIIQGVERFSETLVNSGLLSSSEEEEQTRDVPDPRPSDIYLHLTSQCNLRCVYCYAQRPGDPGGGGVSLPLDAAAKALRDAKELGVKNVFLTGGEPLLNPWAPRIMELCRTLGFRTVLLTNGTVIDAKMAEIIVRYCDQVTVSLDAAQPELHDRQRGTGTHGRVVESMKLLKEAGVREIVASAVITSVNQGESYSRFVDFAHHIGADWVARQVYIAQGDERDGLFMPDFSAIFAELEASIDALVRGPMTSGEGDEPLICRDRCGAGYSVIAVDADGTVYPCQGLVKPEFAAGSILAASLADVYRRSPVLQGVRGITVADISGCGDCAFRHVCGGGCRALAYNVRGDLFASIPEEYCRLNRILAERSLWRAALLGGKKGAE